MDRAFKISDGILDLQSLSFVSKYYEPSQYSTLVEKREDYLQVGGVIIRFIDGNRQMMPCESLVADELQRLFAKFIGGTDMVETDQAAQQRTIKLILQIYPLAALSSASEQEQAILVSLGYTLADGITAVLVNAYLLKQLLLRGHTPA